MTISYAGEQAFWGILGHFFVVVAFVTAVFAALSNAFRVNGTWGGELAWRNTARWLFRTHTLSVVGIFLTLLLMIWLHRFEYQYVWQHSKRDMAMNYILACLWEGQEGSTLLWLFWHALIGLVLLRTAKNWEAPVISILSFVQAFLAMMMLGWYIGDIHIGSNPFALIREQEQNIGLPWTLKADYMTLPMFKDGRGLNPLLQNYWMTIHPPTLFLGFALVTIPFAFALAALWTKQHHHWQQPALPWIFAGVGILGIGILMGGAWAYESLSFGGFWAWDPVENASLVPWLTLVGAAHVMLIYRIKGQSLFMTFFLCILTFLLIVYSTFLTKSGILAETSVHAFTEDGLNQELAIFMLSFLWLSVMLLQPNKLLRLIYTGCTLLLSIFLFKGMMALPMLILLICSIVFIVIAYRKGYKSDLEEEELWSREFWMFLGSLLLTITAGIVILYTSSPVVNKFLRIDIVNKLMTGLHDLLSTPITKQLAEAKLAPGKNVVAFYNGWTIPFAVLVALLMAITQFFRYKKSDPKHVWNMLRRPLFITLAISIPLIILLYLVNDLPKQHSFNIYMQCMCILLLFTTIFTVVGNAEYWFRVLKGKIRHAGSSIAHIGFGLLLLGALISTSKKQTISRNTSTVDITAMDENGSNEENIYLRRGELLSMDPYMIRYTGREYKIKDGTPYVYFNVDYLKRDESGQLEKAFTLRPFIQINERMGNAAEPDTKHYLHKDVYSFIKFVPLTSLQPNEKGKAEADAYVTPKNFTIRRYDTIALENSIAVLDSIYQIDSTNKLLSQDEFAVAARFKVTGNSIGKENMITKMITAYYVVDKKNGETRQIDGRDEELGLKLTFYNLNPKTGRMDVYASELSSVKKDFIVMEASIFPAINILWIGCLLMLIGTVIAIRERVRLTSRKSSEAE
jgi:cytochrome c-type biogenesis protein CcmF